MASLAATNWPKPVVLVPCLSWSTASAVFTEGVMSESIDWNLLQKQYSNNSLLYDRLANVITMKDMNSHIQTWLSLRNTSNDKCSNTNDVLDAASVMKNMQKNEEQLVANELKQSGLLVPNFAKTLRLPTFTSRNLNDQHPLLKRPQDAVHFMRSIMDEFTHLKNFSLPCDTSLITAVCARSDGYVPREGCSSLEEIWPGSTVHYLDAGHVSAYILHRKFFRQCIIDAFEKSKQKYGS